MSGKYRNRTRKPKTADRQTDRPSNHGVSQSGGVMKSTNGWGYLRETSDKAESAGDDCVTHLCRTGLEKYLHAIFPGIIDWVHDKVLPARRNTEKRRFRPDYRSEELNLIVEFDGSPHFTKPTVREDFEKTRYYQRMGYNVVRIPYFIQLTKNSVKKYFDVDVKTDLFDGGYSSLYGDGGCWMPPYICPFGLMRMALEFVRFPEQYEVNRIAMEASASECIRVGSKVLDGLYADFRKRYPGGISDSAKLLSVVANSRLAIKGSGRKGRD